MLINSLVSFHTFCQPSLDANSFIVPCFVNRFSQRSFLPSFISERVMLLLFIIFWIIAALSSFHAEGIKAPSTLSPRVCIFSDKAFLNAFASFVSPISHTFDMSIFFALSPSCLIMFDICWRCAFRSHFIPLSRSHLAASSTSTSLPVNFASLSLTFVKSARLNCPDTCKFSGRALDMYFAAHFVHLEIQAQARGIAAHSVPPIAAQVAISHIVASSHFSRIGCVAPNHAPTTPERSATCHAHFAPAMYHAPSGETPSATSGRYVPALK